ncbi:MAG: hypothetical protein ACR2NZ_10075 [Rubripirellula sp.]
MSVLTLLMAIVLLTAVALTIYGLFVPCRSFPLAILALGVFAIASLGAWYSWSETHSISWTVGYSSVAGIALVSMLRQLLVRPSSSLS